MPGACIYEEQDLPPEFAKDVEFNAVQAKQLKDSGAPAITARKDPLPGAAERKKGPGLLSDHPAHEVIAASSDPSS